MRTLRRKRAGKLACRPEILAVSHLLRPHPDASNAALRIIKLARAENELNE
ncbi:hypothetical protein BOSEA31B_13404 [Hyphomicrobiales bacterium]|nr:hypothetical protein BOSEA31B_13404 [Hyphomicrobiales bacterium]